MAFAREKVFEREAVADERVIMRKALCRGMGEVSFSEIQEEFRRRREEGEFRSVQGQKHSSGRSFTTRETIAAERANVQHVLNGQGASAPMLSAAVAERQTVARMGLDHSMTVKLDSGKTAEVSTAMARHSDYGYAVDGLKSTRAERVIATGNGLTQQNFQSGSSKADLALYTGSPQQEFSAARKLAAPELAQPAKHQHDFGIGF